MLAILSNKVDVMFCTIEGIMLVDKITLDKAFGSHLFHNGGILAYYTKREKTQTPLRILVLPKALDIIEKYRSNIRSNNRSTILPLVSNQKVNSYLKEIADICEIEKNLTFHLARHTFATTVTLSNGVPIETVCNLLGHRSISTTQIYAKVLEDKVSEDMVKLKKRLSGNKAKVMKADEEY